MRYGAPALLLGWFLTFFLVCLGLTASMVVPAAGSGGPGWYFLPIALLYGFPVAAVFGLPLAVLVAWPLRRIRSQWLHVAAFALATGLAFWIAVAGVGGWANLLSGWGVGLFAGVCAAIGRAAVIPMVARRNGRPPTPPVIGPAAS